MAYGTHAGARILDSTEAQGRNTNAIMAGWVDRGPWFYYDTPQAAAGAQLLTSYNVFAVAIGGQNPWVANTQKTKLQTNLPGQGGAFPPPRCLLLMSIGFFFGAQPITVSGGPQNGVIWTSMGLDDINAINNAGYFEFRIDDKIFHEGQIWQYPSGAGVNGVSTQSGQQALHNGLPAPQYTRRYGDWSKYIAPLQQFSLVINFPGTPPTMDSNGPGMYMPTILDGLTDRSVQ